MDTKERLQQCFEKLGYSSVFPSTLHINPSTNFIWQQILNNVKPKKEVEVIRKNLIINNIEKKLLESSVPEIQIYNKLKVAKDDIANIKARILEKQNKLKSLSNNRKATYLIIDSIKQKNEEKKIKTHALKLKSQHQENEIKKIQEMLDKKDISSIPVEQSLSSDAITKILQQLIVKTENGGKLSKYGEFNQFDHSVLSQPSIYSSATRSSKTCFSTVKKSQPRASDLQRFVSCNSLTARALFTETFKENNKNMRNCDELSSLDMSSDLLPESCFDFEADDEFLLSAQPIYRQKGLKSDLSVTLKRGKTFGSVSSICGKSNLNLAEKNKEKVDFLAQALSDRKVTKEIEDLYYSGNRDLIWNCICSLLNNIKLELEKNADSVNSRNREICNDDLMKLNFIFIKNKLMCLKNKKQIKALKNAIADRKLEIKEKLKDHEQGSIQAMELNLDKLKLEVEINYLHREVYNDTNLDNQATLKNLKTKISKSRDELLIRVREIEDYIGIKDELMEKIRKCQEETTVCVRKLSKYFFNLSWADALQEKINSKEMEIFQEFPMGYTKQFCYVDKGAFYRDSLIDVFLDENLPHDVLFEVASLLQHPQNTPEKIIAEIIQKKNKIQVLSSLECPEVSIEEKEYSLHQLQERESYISTFCENMNAAMHSSKVQHILKSSSYSRLNMELWLEVPFRRFISEKRIVEGKTYSEYEKAFDYFRNNH